MEAQRSAGQFRSHVSSLDQDEMNVYLKIMKTIPMRVKRSDTIGTLKAKVNEKEGFSEINQRLLFDGKLLSDAQTVAGSGIQNYVTLHLFVRDDAVIKMFINIPSRNSMIELEANANETVLNVKLMVEKKEGILSNSFTLVYNGKVLDNEKILSSVGIRNNSTVMLVLSKKEVLTIFVKARGMDPVELSVKSMFTVGDVKAILVGMIGERFCNDLGFFCAGKLLDDSRTLAFYDVKEGSCLDLLYTLMPIFVKTRNGKTLALIVHVLDTVNNVIEKAKEKLQIGEVHNGIVSLYYAGKRLKGDKELASYGIQRDSTLHSY